MSKIAVVKTGGKQYIVREGDNLKVEKLIGDNAELETLLLAEPDGSSVTLGRPFINTKSGVTITGQGRAKKINVVHYKAKVRHHKKYGHRQPYSTIRVDKVS